MEKIAQIVLITIILTNTTFGQAFEKGNWNIDLDLGIGAYGTQTTSTVALGTFSQTNTETDGAASSIVKLDVEYGISNRIGLGLRFGSSNYFIAEEDKEDTKSVKSKDVSLHVNFHLLQADRNDLYVGLGLGFSNIEFLYQNNAALAINSFKGPGSYFGLEIGDRIFFGDHVGVLIRLGYAGYSYKQMEADLSDGAEALLGASNVEWDIDFKGSGVNFGVGLALKF
tara:strand:+ start:2522 stop:3199 length:678 start_codon:yes stop_codon:yes gene_type:complete